MGGRYGYYLEQQHAKHNDWVIGDDGKFSHSLAHSVMASVAKEMVDCQKRGHLKARHHQIKSPPISIFHRLFNGDIPISETSLQALVPFPLSTPYPPPPPKKKNKQTNPEPKSLLAGYSFCGKKGHILKALL